ncbi:unnamed protein product [Trifolium pratense]|uniref:Uncharacterized protein n=1 Tax=Trifolium pratense TaxID=57577 RepID=A0ACB0IQS8_TRIPR|nr:unnamed protein product [Trifolium pratense]
MEAELLGFEEVPALEDDEQRKLVPWLDWNEWLSVRDALFSHSSQSLSFALKRISSWRSRGSLPAAIDVTATIVEIQNMDPFFRQDKLDDGSVSEEILSNLYTMAIVRLVNATVEKIGTKEQGSINVRADKICIPRMLIDVRHEGSHRELPSLNVARSASVKALDWLKSYYWEPQSEAIPFQVPKKQIKRILKSVIRLHSSFSSETVSVLLDYLLKTLSSSEFKKNVDDASVGPTIENVLADWKPVILKLYNKEPELHLNLLKEVLHKIEAQEDMKCEEDNSSQGFYQSAYLSSLFAWLVRIHDKKTSVANMPKRVMHELVRKCILISRLCNKQIMDSALHLAKLMDDKSLLKKVQLLSGLALSNIVDNADNQNSSLTSTNVSQFEESLREANKKLELVKQQITRNKQSSEMNCETEETQVWTLAKSWNPCPIGMLPHFIGSSGCLPVLDVIDNETVLDVIDNEEHNQVPASKGNWKLIKHGAKRDAPSDIQLLDNSTAKKMRETEEPGELNSETPTEEDELPTEEGKGYLIVGGIWKKVTEEELLAIQSSVRILI